MAYGWKIGSSLTAILARKLLHTESMQALRLVMLLVALAVGYLLFFSTQPKLSDLPPADLTQNGKTAQTASNAPAHNQYKEAMDRAHSAADAMTAQRKEADSD